jgi:hypothetical protein
MSHFSEIPRRSSDLRAYRWGMKTFRSVIPGLARHFVIYCGLIAWATAAWAGQSLQMGNGYRGTYSVPNQQPYSGLTSFYFDVRIHDWEPPPTCQNFFQTPGVVNNPFQLRMCPNGFQPGILQVAQGTDNTGGAGVGVNPPSVTITSMTFDNPAVLTLNGPLPATVKPGGTLVIINPGNANSGCAALKGKQRVLDISGNSVTIDLNGTQCATYAAGSAAAAVSDFVFRFQRDVENLRHVLEVWNVDGTMYSRQVISLKSIGALVLPQNSLQAGDSGINAGLAYVRWFSGAPGLQAKPPAATPGGNLGDWEFEGNTLDSSGMNRTLSASSGQPAFGATPTYAPACSAGPPTTFRAGAPAKLDGTQSFPLDGGTNLTYVWQVSPVELSGVAAQSPTFSSQTDAQPTVTDLVAGPVEFQLTVTQGDSQSSNCSVRDGVAATDDAGNVVIPDPAMRTLLGPLTKWGTSPWPWFDEIEKLWADHMGELQGKVLSTGLTRNFIDTWNNAQAGTVNVTRGSVQISGAGTDFKTLFCSGGDVPTQNMYIVGWYTYPIAGGGGGTGREYHRVTQCSTATDLTIDSPWRAASESDIQYSYITDVDLFTWISGSSNVNYYDNVLAFYSMYYRSGMAVYLQYARWLADTWWNSPFVDRGNCKHGDVGWCLFPRMQAMAGLFARAIDQDMESGMPGSSPMWPGLRTLVDGAFRYTMNAAANGNVVITDLRENSYNDLFVAMDAALDPDDSRRAQLRADLSNSLVKRWQAQRQPDGHWQAIAGTWTNLSEGNNINETGHQCTVTVTQGSTDVLMENQGSGCAFQSSWFTDTCASGPCAEFFTLQNPFDSSTWDPQTPIYIATFVDGTRIKLDPPYGGDSNNGRSWILSSDRTAGSGHAWIGFGTQPFMLGITTQLFYFMHNAFSMDPAYDTQADLAKSFAVDASLWIANNGVDAATRGAFYGVGFGQCNPGTDTNGCRCGPANLNCTTAEASRENMGEALGAMALGYAYSGNPGLADAIDNVFSATYAKFPTDARYDGIYARDLDPFNSGFFWGTNNGKWNGFFWGTGRGQNWLSARQGGLGAADNRTIQVAFDLAKVPNAASAKVTVIQPDGSSVTVSCAASPCAVRADARQGRPLVKIQYLSTSGKVLAVATRAVAVVLR